MSGDSSLQELSCSNCGSPIRTTAAPGTTVTCDCCGSAILLPERPGPDGVLVAHADSQSEVAGGDKIIAKESQVLILGKDAPVIMQDGDKGKADPQTTDPPWNEEPGTGA